MTSAASSGAASEQLRPLEASCPREVAYLLRQIGFASGFYQVTDFWGSL